MLNYITSYVSRKFAKLLASRAFVPNVPLRFTGLRALHVFFTLTFFTVGNNKTNNTYQLRSYDSIL